MAEKQTHFDLLWRHTNENCDLIRYDVRLQWMDVRPVRVSWRYRSRYRLAASTAFSSREKEASIPDDSAVQTTPQLDGLAHA